MATHPEELIKRVAKSFYGETAVEHAVCAIDAIRAYDAEQRKDAGGELKATQEMADAAYKAWSTPKERGHDHMRSAVDAALAVSGWRMAAVDDAMINVACMTDDHAFGLHDAKARESARSRMRSLLENALDGIIHKNQARGVVHDYNGNQYTMSCAWDGERLKFMVNGEEYGPKREAVDLRAKLDECNAEGVRWKDRAEGTEQRASAAERIANEYRSAAYSHDHECMRLTERAEKAEADAATYLRMYDGARAERDEANARAASLYADVEAVANALTAAGFTGAEDGFANDGERVKEVVRRWKCAKEEVALLMKVNAEVGAALTRAGLFGDGGYVLRIERLTKQRDDWKALANHSHAQYVKVADALGYAEWAEGTGSANVAAVETLVGAIRELRRTSDKRFELDPNDVDRVTFRGDVFVRASSVKDTGEYMMESVNALQTQLSAAHDTIARIAVALADRDGNTRRMMDGFLDTLSADGSLPATILHAVGRAREAGRE